MAKKRENKNVGEKAPDKPSLKKEREKSGSSADTSKENEKKHVAVVFFHGMGQQRHYESTAELVESIDDWVYTQHEKEAMGYPYANIKRSILRERCNGGQEREEMVCFQTEYQNQRVKYYEGYWAPATSMGTSGLKTFYWLMKQIPRPLKVLLSPWRAYARIRRGDLVRWMLHLQEEEGKKKAFGQVRSLAQIYNQFTRSRGPSRGSFSEFKSYIKSKRKDERQNDLLSLAGIWKRYHRRIELKNLATLSLLGLSIAACYVLLIAGVLWLLGEATGIIDRFEVFRHVETGDRLAPTISNAVALTSLLIGALGINRFFRDYVGDIKQFVMYEEVEPLHARRVKVLENARKTLRHVLLDPACERIVVVAHSLGTAVALDAILSLRGENEITQPKEDKNKVMEGPLPLHRIAYFITCGSPVDKINYFFATIRSPTRLFESMVEELKGDIGSIPFSKSGRQPHIHWVNFWDRGDPISGPIETVASYILREQRVDNVQISNYLFPDPAASHTHYFRHRRLIKFIFEAAYLDAHSFTHPQKNDQMRPVWPWIGPGKNSRLQRVLHATIPLWGISLIGTAFAIWIPGLESRFALPFLGMLTGIMVVLAAVQRLFGFHRDPIR